MLSIEKFKIFNFRVSALYGLCYWQGLTLGDDIKQRYDDEWYEEIPFYQQLRLLTRYDWLKNQSYCWPQKSKLIEFSETFTPRGLCFTLYSNPKDFLNSKTLVNNIWLLICNQQLICFDYVVFLEISSLTYRCRQVVSKRLRCTKKTFCTLDQASKSEKTSKTSLVSSLFTHQTKCLKETATHCIYLFQMLLWTLKSHSSILIWEALLHKCKCVYTWVKRLLNSAINFSRDCYFEDERKLTFFKKYTKKNCIKECMSKVAFEICGCTQVFWIRKLWSDQWSVILFNYIFFYRP